MTPMQSLLSSSFRRLPRRYGDDPRVLMSSSCSAVAAPQVRG